MPSKVVVKVFKKKAVARIRAESRRRVRDAAILYRKEVVLGLRGERSGREYYHPHGGTYRASTRREMPAYRTGRLLRSITSDRAPRDTPKGMEMRVGSAGLTPPYGRILQSKKRKKGRRRFLTMTLDRVLPRMLRILRGP